MFKLTQITRNTSTVPELKNCLADVKKKNPGFLRILNDHELLNSSQKRAQEIHSQFDQMIVLGIGGSSLGAKAIVHAFDLKEKVLFYENLDAYNFHNQISKIKNLKRVHWTVISKSGTTIETLTQLQFVHEYYEKQGLDIKKQMTVVTEKKSNPLFNFATKHNIPVLEIPLDVGGRFSVLTPVGMFPAAFAGLNIESILKGAREVLNNEETLLNFCTQMLESFRNNQWITIMWIYSEGLKTFGLWFQQLWAESLAKKLTYSGTPAPRVSTPMMMVGSNDQHSMLQQVMEGEKDKFVIFVRSNREENFGEKLNSVLFDGYEFLKNESMGKVLKAQSIGTQEALLKEGVHSTTIELTKFDEEEMGALFLFFEMVIALLGQHHNIDAYNQPGVELSKRLTLDHLRSR